jgi:hypothetical protein
VRSLAAFDHVGDVGGIITSITDAVMKIPDLVEKAVGATFSLQDRLKQRQVREDLVSLSRDPPAAAAGAGRAGPGLATAVPRLVQARPAPVAAVVRLGVPVGQRVGTGETTPSVKDGLIPKPQCTCA